MDTLAQRIKAKHPGAYDDMDDAALEDAMDRKYPGAYKDIPRTQSAGKPADPTEGMSGTQRLVTGIGQGLTSMGRGAQQMLLSPYEGKPIEARRGELAEQESEARQIDKPLLATGAGKTGSIIGKALPALGASVIPGANTLAGSMVLGGLTGGAEPTLEDESRVANVALGTAGGAAGYGAGKVIEKGLGAVSSALGSPQRQAAKQASNALRDQVAQEARAAGYVFPPSQTNPTLGNRMLEGTAGKITTAQHAAKANEATTQRLAGKALGLRDVNPASVSAVRDKAGLVYEELKNQGQMHLDDAFHAQLSKIGASSRELGQELPSMALPDDPIVKDLASRSAVSAKSAVEAVKRLRQEAKTLWRVAEGETDAAVAAPGRAMAKQQAADAIEGAMERNLAQTNPGLMASFRKARTDIAKAHAIESAMNETTGQVSAASLGKQLAAGAPLSGELATIARASRAFPKATQSLQGQSVLPISPLDMTNFGITGGIGGAATAATGNPLFMLPMAGAMARPGIRAGILSAPYQRAFGTPSYAPALTSTQQLARAIATGGGAALLPNLPQK
jgi:hypothetical protein